MHFKKLIPAIFLCFVGLTLLTIVLLKTGVFGQRPAIYFNTLVRDSKSGFGKLIDQTSKKPELPKQVKPPTRYAESERISLASLASLPAKIFLKLKPKKKTYYSENAQTYFVESVKDNIRDDLTKLAYQEPTEEDINKLSEKILSSLDESEKQIGQQIKPGKRKIEAKTSIKGEVILPASIGNWRLDVHPVESADIWLPEQKIKILKDMPGAVLYIPMKKGEAKVNYSDKVAPLPLNLYTISPASQATEQTLAAYLDDPVNPDQKMCLILIFNDQNENLIFDPIEKLVPWAGVTFYLTKSLI